MNDTVSRLRELLAEGWGWNVVAGDWAKHDEPHSRIVLNAMGAWAVGPLRKSKNEAARDLAAVNALPKLLDVVTEYADHRPGCPKWGIEGDSLGLDGDVFAVSAGDECRCGFDAALASLETET
jgi:hypothetical protein